VSNLAKNSSEFAKKMCFLYKASKFPLAWFDNLQAEKVMRQDEHSLLSRKLTTPKIIGSWQEKQITATLHKLNLDAVQLPLLQLQILSGLCEICFGHVDYYYYYYYPMT
jgi:hypothetical protein